MSGKIELTQNDPTSDSDENSESENSESEHSESEHSPRNYNLINNDGTIHSTYVATSSKVAAMKGYIALKRKEKNDKLNP
jgi:hypothetical protein